MRKRFLRALLAAGALFAAASSAAWAETEVRVASYNIKFLDASKLPQQGDREAKLKQVVDELDADVIALQEINDREALERIFDKSKWSLVIDDDSGDAQDVAVAVRKPLEVAGLAADAQGRLNSADADFLFPAAADNTHFPGRRDVLRVKVRVPAEDFEFTVLVCHPKARVGGRQATEARRVGAAKALLAKLRADFTEEAFVLLGDMNDNPDDRSMNILETGDEDALGGREDIQGPFLWNLSEPLAAADRVSHGRTSGNVVGERVDTAAPGSRKENNDLRGTDLMGGDILFDQILIPAWMHAMCAAGSAHVFDREVAVRGNGATRASDHLPVYADFVFEKSEPEPDLPPAGQAVALLELLPNPDAGGPERVGVSNPGAAAMPLSGWRLVDRAGNERALSGTVPSGGALRVALPPPAMLNNTGDEVWLVGPDGLKGATFTYSGAEAVRGAWVRRP